MNLQNRISSMYNFMRLPIALLLVFAIPASSGQPTNYHIKVPIGEFKTQTISGNITRIAISSPEIADYTIVNSREILINGKTTGRTSMKVWSGDQEDLYMVEVIDLRQAKLEGMISNPNIRVQFVGDDIVLNGSVKSQNDKGRAGEMAGAFLGGKGSVKNLIQISGMDSIAEKVQRLLKNPDVVVTYTDRGVIISGTVETDNDRTNAEKVVKAYMPDPTQDLTNVLQIRRKPRQVRMKVRVMEISENASKTHGIDWGGYQGSVVTRTVTSGLHNQWTAGSAISGIPPRVMLHLRRSNPLTVLDPFMAQVNWLVDSGIIRILAEPELVALSGAKSDVLIGGQIPIPMVTSSQMSVEWRDYGIKMSLEPTIHEDSYVTAKIYTEVSTIDDANAVVTSGFSIPAIKITQASSEINVESGRTVFLSGLKRETVTKTHTGVRGLSEMPVWGSLFAAKGKTVDKIELIISVTPFIVDAGGI